MQIYAIPMVLHYVCHVMALKGWPQARKKHE
jgi:hypothetical protein